MGCWSMKLTLHMVRHPEILLSTCERVAFVVLRQRELCAMILRVQGRKDLRRGR